MPGSGRVYGRAVVGREDAGRCGGVLGRTLVDLGVGAPRVAMEQRELPGRVPQK
jgi:hypothetical protein